MRRPVTNEAVEMLARRMCVGTGNDPDKKVSKGSPYLRNTPSGPVYEAHDDTVPLWECYAHAARLALESIDDGLPEGE